DTTSGALVRIAEIDRATAAASILPALGNDVGTPGSWETSGVIDASALYGPGTWLIDVQAHTIQRNNPLVGKEGGQLLLLDTSGPTPQLNTNGTLIVPGTAGKDDIAIKQQKNGLITATVNGELTGTAFAGLVKSIIVNANDGNDKVTVDKQVTAP